LKVLVVGNGAREHALVWKIARSPLAGEIFALPGNAGTDGIARNIDIPSSDIPAIVARASELRIDLVVIGPEAPLAAGLTDRLQEAGIRVFGPSQAAARLESSKSFARELMLRNNVPCAAGSTFTDFETARSYLAKQPVPIVVKADGLAAGKGVTVAATREEAQAALDSMMKSRVFGAAGNTVIIEECLVGKEVSLLAFCDGKTVVPMVPACDYKRVFDGDLGPNTGGMGSYSPPGFFDQSMMLYTLDNMIRPVVQAMAKDGTPYRGVLYTGLIMTGQGPKVLEFNARFGDPETQCILPRLKSDLLEIMLSVADGTLDKMKIEWSPEPCVGVVLSSGGYPGTYKTGFAVNISRGIDKDVNIFYAGAKKTANGQIITDGGRVMTVAASGLSMREAREKVYHNLDCIEFEGKHYRSDIAAREVT
jgi:phosphoribosylamine--glycine ligase